MEWGAHAAGVPFSAARRKLRPAIIAALKGAAMVQNTKSEPGRLRQHAGRVRSPFNGMVPTKAAVRILRSPGRIKYGPQPAPGEAKNSLANSH